MPAHPVAMCFCTLGADVARPAYIVCACCDCARFGILAKGLKKFIDIEIQVLDTDEVDERAMYHLSLLVAMSLKKGQSYVVFFCKTDIFGQGLPVYEFQMMCTNFPDLKLYFQSACDFL